MSMPVINTKRFYADYVTLQLESLKLNGSVIECSVSHTCNR